MTFDDKKLRIEFEDDENEFNQCVIIASECLEIEELLHMGSLVNFNQILKCMFTERGIKEI